MESATLESEAVASRVTGNAGEARWEVLSSKGVDAFVDSYVEAQQPPSADEASESFSTKELEAALRALHSKVSNELDVSLLFFLFLAALFFRHFFLLSSTCNLLRRLCLAGRS